MRTKCGRPVAGGDRASEANLRTGDVQSLGKHHLPVCPVLAEAIIAEVDQMSDDEIDADMATWTAEEWREVRWHEARMRRLGLLPAVQPQIAGHEHVAVVSQSSDTRMHEGRDHHNPARRQHFQIGATSRWQEQI
jgi:hypothetical protein